MKISMEVKSLDLETAIHYAATMLSAKSMTGVIVDTEFGIVPIEDRAGSRRYYNNYSKGIYAARIFIGQN